MFDCPKCGSGEANFNTIIGLMVCQNCGYKDHYEKFKSTGDDDHDFNQEEDFET